MIKELLYKWFGIDERPCQSCETLRMQLSIANHEKEQLLNTILSLTTEKPKEQPAPAVNYENIPRPMTWNMRKAMLEAEDRKAAQLLAENKKKEQIKADIEKLEEELDIKEEVKGDA